MAIMPVFRVVYKCDFLESINEDSEVISSSKPHHRPECQFYRDKDGRCSHPSNILNICHPKTVDHIEEE